MQTEEDNDDGKLSKALKALDDVLAEKSWDSSNFLRLIATRLRGIRDDLALSSPTPHEETETHEVHNHSKKTLYVSLYAADGIKIPNWERILSNLPKQVVSRPIYAEEVHVQTLIKSKTNQINEAYAIVLIDPENILVLPPDKAVVDKHGHSLVNLKDNAISLENITRFVHASGNYRYVKGRLLLL